MTPYDIIVKRLQKMKRPFMPFINSFGYSFSIDFRDDVNSKDLWFKGDIAEKLGLDISDIWQNKPSPKKKTPEQILKNQLRMKRIKQIPFVRSFGYSYTTDFWNDCNDGSFRLKGDIARKAGLYPTDIWTDKTEISCTGSSHSSNDNTKTGICQ